MYISIQLKMKWYSWASLAMKEQKLFITLWLKVRHFLNLDPWTIPAGQIPVWKIIAKCHWLSLTRLVLHFGWNSVLRTNGCWGDFLASLDTAGPGTCAWLWLKPPVMNTSKLWLIPLSWLFTMSAQPVTVLITPLVIWLADGCLISFDILYMTSQQTLLFNQRHQTYATVRSWVGRTQSRCVPAGQMEWVDLQHTLGIIFKLTLGSNFKIELHFFFFFCTRQRHCSQQLLTAVRKQKSWDNFS